MEPEDEIAVISIEIPVTKALLEDRTARTFVVHEASRQARDALDALFVEQEKT